MIRPALRKSLNIVGFQIKMGLELHPIAFSSSLRVVRKASRSTAEIHFINAAELVTAEIHKEASIEA
jgi:hypothetical protein